MTKRVCSEYLYMCKDVEITNKNLESYVKNRLARKPENVDSNDFVDNLYESIFGEEGRPTVRSI